VIGLGDEKVEVGAGDAILTGFHGIQSVDAIGEEPYRMLVIEALPPEIEAGLPEHRPSEEVATADDASPPAAPAEQGAAA
jgi:mannose-6-phosphate isomerase-like protein (cupin superfamily)